MIRPEGPKARKVKVAKICADESAQLRAAISKECVADYAELMADGVCFPPVTLFEDGGRLWLADGFHRVAAARVAGLKSIAAEVHDGGKRDAALYAASANAAHGLARTNADKRAAVTLLLTDPEWARWSDRRVAKHCGVTHPFVAKLRPEVVTVTTLCPALEVHAANIARASLELLDAEDQCAIDLDIVAQGIARRRAMLATNRETLAELERCNLDGAGPLVKEMRDLCEGIERELEDSVRRHDEADKDFRRHRIADDEAHTMRTAAKSVLRGKS